MPLIDNSVAAIYCVQCDIASCFMFIEAIYMHVDTACINMYSH